MMGIKGECYFKSGEDFNSKSFRIPFVEVTNNWVIIAGGDVRYDGPSDLGNISIGITRKITSESKWVHKQVVLDNHRKVENSRIIDGCILVDRSVNRTFIFGHCIDSDHLWEREKDPSNIDAYMVYTYSDDDGETWSDEISLKHLKDDTMVSLFPAPGKGIQLDDGTLVVPCQIKTNEDNVPQIQSTLIYSKDGGQTWHHNKGRVSEFSSECQLVEIEPGKIVINCRGYCGYRRVFITEDLGTTFIPHETNCNTLIEPVACQGSLDKVSFNGKDIYVFCNPNDSKERKNITLKYSEDLVNWNELITLVEEETYGYTCVTHHKENLYIAVERTGDMELYMLNVNNI